MTARDTTTTDRHARAAVASTLPGTRRGGGRVPHADGETMPRGAAVYSKHVTAFLSSVPNK